MTSKKEIVSKVFEVLHQSTGGLNFPLPTHVDTRDGFSGVAWNHLESDVGLMAGVSQDGDVLFCLVGINTKAKPGTKRDEEGYNEMVLLDNSSLTVHLVYGYLAGFREHSQSFPWDQVPDEVEALPGFPRDNLPGKSEDADATV